MTPTECTKILMPLVRAIAPSQKFEPGDEESPGSGEAWFVLVGHLPLEVAREAVLAVGARQAYIAPSDVLKEVGARLRQARVRHREEVEQDPTLLPAADPDDPVAYREALREGRYYRPQAAEGKTAVDVRKAINGVFPHVREGLEDHRPRPVRPGLHELEAAVAAERPALHVVPDVVDAEIVEDHR